MSLELRRALLAAQLCIAADDWLHGAGTLDDVVAADSALRAAGRQDPTALGAEVFKSDVLGPDVLGPGLRGQGQTPRSAVRAGAFVELLPALRAQHELTGLCLLLPSPGAPNAVGLPPELLRAEMATGFAMIGIARDTAYAVLLADDWTASDIGQQAPALLANMKSATVRQMNRELDWHIREAAVALSALQLERSNPKVVTSLEAADRWVAEIGVGLPHDPRVLLASATRIRVIVDVALTDDGAAVTAGEARMRAERLRPLAAVASRAIGVAASWRYLSGEAQGLQSGPARLDGHGSMRG